MILAILFAVLGWRKAEETGRSKVLWAFLMVVFFIGGQLFAGIAIGVFLGFGIEAFGWSESVFDDYYWPISIVSLAFAIGMCSLVLYLLGRRSGHSPVDDPPPPEMFDLK